MIFFPSNLKVRKKYNQITIIDCITNHGLCRLQPNFLCFFKTSESSQMLYIHTYPCFSIYYLFSYHLFLQFHRGSYVFLICCGPWFHVTCYIQQMRSLAHDYISLRELTDVQLQCQAADFDTNGPSFHVSHRTDSAEQWIISEIEPSLLYHVIYNENNSILYFHTQKYDEINYSCTNFSPNMKLYFKYFIIINLSTNKMCNLKNNPFSSVLKTINLKK